MFATHVVLTGVTSVVAETVRDDITGDEVVRAYLGPDLIISMAPAVCDALGDALAMVAVDPHPIVKGRHGVT